MLTDKQIEREEAFCDDWYMVRKMSKTPTFADAIAWADKTMIEKACECIIKLHNWPIQYEEFAKFQEEFIKEFRKAMED